MIELIIPVILGICAGIVTGLIPGIHINLVSMIVLVNFAILSVFFDISHLIVFIVSMGTTHTFVDFIPSVLFGVPSSDTALSVLPAHQLVLDGRAYQAIFLSSIGSLFGMFFAYSIIPLFYFFLESTYDFIREYIPYLLLFTLVTLIILEREPVKVIWASIVVLMAGGLGMLILNTSLTDQPLLILFTGLFGIAGIFHSIKTEDSIFPKQSLISKIKFDFTFFKAIFVGGVSSTVCSVSPGIGNAQAGTLASVFFKKLDAEIFIVVLSAINTINFILSFLTFYLIDRTRNGSVYVISQIVERINFSEILLYFSIIGLVAITAFFLTLRLGRLLIKVIEKIDFRKVNFAILFFLILLIYGMTNTIGLIILIAASAIGILCISVQVRRVHMMGVLLVPVIINLI